MPQTAIYMEGDAVEHRAGQGQRGLGDQGGVERGGDIGEISLIITSSGLATNLTDIGALLP